MNRIGRKKSSTDFETTERKSFEDELPMTADESKAKDSERSLRIWREVHGQTPCAPNKYENNILPLIPKNVANLLFNWQTDCQRQNEQI